MAGPGHLQSGLPNQDAWAFRRFGPGMALALSDGLGSCKYADLGAKAACRAVMEAASLHFRYSAGTLLSMPAYTRNIWTMMLTGHPVEECSATCLFVVAGHPAGSILAMLGDGLIAACRNSGEVDILQPEKFDSFSNVTTGLGSPAAAKGWRTITVPDDRYCAFVLCSDGISDDLEPEAVRGFAWDVYSHYKNTSPNQRRREVRRWLRDWPVPGHSDDKTIVCFHRSEATDD